MSGPPVNQAQSDSDCQSASAAGTGAAAAAYGHVSSKVLCQTEGKRFHAVQTILHGLESRDGTCIRSKGMLSTFCSAHSNKAKTYRTLRYGIEHRPDTFKVLTDIV